VGTACAKNKVFELARGEMVLCIDSHVLLVPGALKDIPITDDLIHGPLMYCDIKNYCCEWLPVWRGYMWGIWGEYSDVLPKEPFEIWGNGTGLMLAKKSSWLGYNKKFKGFGGEEGYIQEKYRKAGRKVMCYPSLVWMHMFDRKIPYPLKMVDRVRNYLIGFEEIGLDISPVIEHFGLDLIEEARRIIANEKESETYITSSFKKLIFTNAEYGANEKFVNVLDIIKAQQTNNNIMFLKVDNNSMKCDPIQKVKKVLKLSYTLENVPFNIQIKEGEFLIEKLNNKLKE
jgi:hypothetical protein